MLLVPTEVRASKIHGLGCFALKPVKKGTLIWEFSVLFDKIIEVGVAEAVLDELTYGFLCTYAYTDDHYFVMSGDQAKYFNHSDNPNIGYNPNEPESDEEGSIFDSRYALRDIGVNEELTENYMEEEDA